MAKVHVKKGDQVYVLSGKDRARTGKVLRVLPKTGKVVVEGVNNVTKHRKAQSVAKPGGIIEFEAPIDASNVMYVCDKCKRPSKLGVKVHDNGERVRYCKACGVEIDSLSKKR